MVKAGLVKSAPLSLAVKAGLWPLNNLGWWWGVVGQPDTTACPPSTV